MTGPLRVHCLQHVSFEHPARIGDWIRGRGHRLTITRLYRGEIPPAISQVDWIVVMGGPMNVNQLRAYPWLIHEKRFLAAALRANKTILGVCLGAQLLADVLGAKVYQNPFVEIGWFPISLRADKIGRAFFPEVPRKFTVFHWHGDTYDLPLGATCLASSAGCAQQAFLFGARVIGLQFHLESTEASVSLMLKRCGGELVQGRFIQSASQISRSHEHFAENTRALSRLLEELESRTLETNAR